jgi:co-chaperonin GroES (HSP10)
MAIKPILHRILVKPDDVFETDAVYRRAKEAGIDVGFATEKEREQAAIDTGTVILYGPTAFRDFGADNPLSPGVKVIYAKYGGKAVVDPSTKEKYVVLNDEDIIAVLEGA